MGKILVNSVGFLRNSTASLWKREKEMSDEEVAGCQIMHGPVGHFVKLLSLVVGSHTGFPFIEIQCDDIYV